MSSFQFVVLALAIWRLSNLLVAEDGPWMIFEHIRLKVGLQPPIYPGLQRETDPPGKMPGTLFNCVWCMSVWVAFGFLGLYLISPALSTWIAMPFALSAVSCVIDRWGNKV